MNFQTNKQTKKKSFSSYVTSLRILSQETKSLSFFVISYYNNLRMQLTLNDTKYFYPFLPSKMEYIKLVKDVGITAAIVIAIF